MTAQRFSLSRYRYLAYSACCSVRLLYPLMTTVSGNSADPDLIPLTEFIQRIPAILNYNFDPNTQRFDRCETIYIARNFPILNLPFLLSRPSAATLKAITSA